MPRDPRTDPRPGDEQAASMIARCVRGCATDQQYIELTDAIAAALAAEREACAKVADEWATKEQRMLGNGGPAAAIRARGTKP